MGNYEGPYYNKDSEPVIDFQKDFNDALLKLEHDPAEINIFPHTAIEIGGESNFVYNHQMQLCAYPEGLNFFVESNPGYMSSVIKRVLGISDPEVTVESPNYPNPPTISYPSINGNSTPFSYCIEIRIAKGPIIRIPVNLNDYTYYETIKNRIQIIIPNVNYKNIDHNSIYSQLAESFSILGINDCLDTPSIEVREKTKEDLYRGYYNISPNEPLNSNQIADISKMKRCKVSDGYNTYIIPDHINTLQKKDKAILAHRLWEQDSIMKIIKSGHMYSSHSRFLYGMPYNGMSTHLDLSIGSGDNVFGRLYDGFNSITSHTVIFYPRCLDRLDIYANPSDEYGDLGSRVILPDLLKQNIRYHDSNEVMIPHAVPLRDVRCIVVPSNSIRDKLLNELGSLGYDNINGNPIEDFIVLDVRDDFYF